ncbi:hypothetical protein O1611_g2180 [Lasiodiplodia mahajangana]|uniref:Uncharacterized protein n=1 Tax=Lasiodiplodia mahajangana TaxID=1108764 RepID=A0ACC2JVH4_9PEZI|nr:hypothetical protein O1611_g2180 [Lasiodiplodia mahajangana]
MVDLAARGANLLRSGDWSDFTLMCQDRVFRVHKNIICPESPVLAAALFDQKIDISEFIEYWTVQIEAEFDPSTLQCMLDFIYTGTYRDTPFKLEYPPQSSWPSQSNHLARPSQSARAVFTPAWDPEAQPVPIEKDEEKHVVRTVSDALVYHTRVNRIAAHYGVVELVSLSAERVQLLLTENWSLEAFFDLTGEIKGSKIDNTLRQVIVRAAGEQILDLGNTDRFVVYMEQDLFDEIRVSSVGAFGAARARIRALTAEISEKKNESEELSARVEKVMDAYGCRARSHPKMQTFGPAPWGHGSTMQTRRQAARTRSPGTSWTTCTRDPGARTRNTGAQVLSSAT